MYGTFIGDIVGAPYEFDRGPRDKSVRFFAHPKSRFTDDSLLTVAIGEALMDLNLSEQFGYNLITGVAQLQKHNLFINEQKLRPMTQNETCQVCVPQAIVCFLESESYEDAIQNAISIGGDTDTIGAITGSMAEAFYGVPARLRDQADSRLDDKMRAVARRFLAERSPLREPVAAELASEQFDPLAEIERQAKSGDVNYSVFLEQLEQLAQVSGPGSLRRRFAEFALQAVRTGYPLSDLKTLFAVRRALDLELGVPGQAAAEARARCETV